MSNEAAGQRYVDRLSEGDIVFVVEGDSVNDSIDDKPVVKKARVIQVDWEGRRLDRPRVLFWRNAYEDPGGGMSAGKLPHEIFTQEEIWEAIRQHDESLAIGSRSLENLVEDPISNRDLTVVLGSVVIERLAEDGTLHPGNLDY